MNYKRLLKTKVGIIFISIMLGLGLAVLFRTACKGKDCLNFKGPQINDIKGKTYQFGDNCYNYNAVAATCNNNKQTLTFSNKEGLSSSDTEMFDAEMPDAEMSDEEMSDEEMSDVPIPNRKSNIMWNKLQDNVEKVYVNTIIK